MPPADKGLPPVLFGRRGSAASGALPVWLQVGDRFFIIVFLCATRSCRVGTREREREK